MGCSCHDIDWLRFGFDGRNLGWLLAQAGWFHQGHRAPADVDALVTLLGTELPEQATVLRTLIDRAQQPTWLVRAIGAHFDVKDR